MKKLLIAIIVLLSSLFMLGKALAISGECSSHAGVNCAAGASVSGYAVCNDGTVSSIPYFETIECQGTVTCTQDQMNGLEQKYNALDDVNQIAALNNQITQIKSNALAQETGMASKPGVAASIINGGIQSVADAAQGKIDNLENQIAVLQTDLYIKQSEISSACTADAYQIQNQQIANQVAQQEQQMYNQAIQEKRESERTACSSFGGVIISDGTCACPSEAPYNSTANRCVAKIQPQIQTQPSAPIVATQSTQTTTTSFKISSNLQIGALGPDVVTLQKFLENKGLLTLPAGVTEGYFGLLTKQALISFQQSTGLPTTGYCGPMTRGVINNTQ